MIRANKIIALAGIAATVLVLGIPEARAGIVLGAAANFAVYGYGSLTTQQLGNGPLSIDGNVGAGAGGKVSLSGAGVTIGGQILFADPVTSSNFTTASLSGATVNGSAFSGSISAGLASGQLVQNSAAAANAQADLLALYNASVGLASTAGAPTKDLTGNFSWTGSGGQNIANLNSFNYDKSDVLTLTGGANDTSS